MFQCGALYAVEWTPLRKPHEIEGKKFFPPLEIPTALGPVSLIGTLSDVSDKGLLFHGETDWKSAIQAWPLYLAYRCLYPDVPQLLLTKEGIAWNLPIEDPQKLLGSYLEYYFLAKQIPSPLMPLWAKSILTQSPQEVSKAFQAHYEEDPYIVYLQQRGALEELIEHLDFWNRSLQQTFHPLIEVLS